MRTNEFLFTADIEKIYQNIIKTIKPKRIAHSASATLERFISSRGYDYDHAVKVFAKEKVIYLLNKFPNPRLIADGFISHEFLQTYPPDGTHLGLYGYLLTNRGETFIDEVLKLLQCPLVTGKLEIPLNHGLLLQQVYYKPTTILESIY